MKNICFCTSHIYLFSFLQTVCIYVLCWQGKHEGEAGRCVSKCHDQVALLIQFTLAVVLPACWWRESACELEEIWWCNKAIGNKVKHWCYVFCKALCPDIFVHYWYWRTKYSILENKSHNNRVIMQCDAIVICSTQKAYLASGCITLLTLSIPIFLLNGLTGALQSANISKTDYIFTDSENFCKICCQSKFTFKLSFKCVWLNKWLV